MPLINKSFTFVQCTDCKKTMKLDVGRDLEGLKCSCKEVEPVIVLTVEEKPKRMRKKVVEDDT